MIPPLLLAGFATGLEAANFAMGSTVGRLFRWISTLNRLAAR